MANTNKLLQNRVEMLLRAKPIDRNSDFALILDYIDTYCIDTDEITLKEALNHAKDFNVPSFESITRARRKVQELYPELMSDKQVERARQDLQKTFRLDYAN
jgi:hypothetical protein